MQEKKYLVVEIGWEYNDEGYDSTEGGYYKLENPNVFTWKEAKNRRNELLIEFLRGENLSGYLYDAVNLNTFSMYEWDTADH